MDAWCSLYFWPLDDAANLPSRAAWLAAAEVLLGVGVEDDATRHLLDLRLGDEIDLEGLFAAVQGRLPDASALARAVPWFGVARATVARQPFHHWELVFTEVLGPAVAGHAPPRGFDLMFGNPPWIKVSWNDAPLLAEFEPKLGVRDAKSATYNRERARLLEVPHQRVAYRDAFEQGEGVGVFLNDRTLYPSLAGVQTNLYKNFIERSWACWAGRASLGCCIRKGCSMIRRVGCFGKGITGGCLATISSRTNASCLPMWIIVMAFSVNIYRGEAGAVAFQAMFNLFDPGTIGQSQRHGALHDPIPGIKDDAGAWETRGHAERILTITEHELALFARLFEDADTPPLQARLPQVHSRPLLKVLEKFAAAPRRLGDLKGEYLATVMFDETYAQRDGIITRQEDPSFQPERPDDWVISGPHFFVGTPLNKTPRTSCTANGHYDDIDLTEIPDDYLPRAVYRPGDRDGDLTAFYQGHPGVAQAAQAWDFLIKMSGRGDVYASSLKMLPIGTMADEQIKVRALRLSCVSVAFEELWANAFRDDFRSDSWALADTRLFQSGQLDWSALGPGWERGCALRNDLAKRQALLEIDVLVALALNLSIDELIQIYEVQFPVMKAYEEADRYDARGRRLPNTARKDAGGRELRDALADHDGQSSVTVSWTIDNGQREVTRTFHPPFTPADRIEDYRVAYRVFSERFAARGAE
jgi:hypothetical protein